MDNGATGGDPFANGCSYGSQYVEWQNCIIIDQDSAYWSGAVYGAFGGVYFRHTYTEVSPPNSDTNNAMRGGIILNSKIRPNMGSFGVNLSIGYGATFTAFENNIYWDMINMMYWDNSINGVLPMNHNTIGQATFSGSYSYGSTGSSTSYGDISNSIYVNLSGTAIASAKSSNYNAFYGNGTNKSSVGSSANDVTSINPLTNHLKYLPRIEGYTGLDGNDGKKMGAEVLWKYGVDGSLHGDTGYATLRNAANGYGGTADQLWPFPYESTIKTFFLTYGTGGGSPANARGFTTGTSMDGSAQSLTKYIWEYLGNQIPADIYGEDTTPPTVSSIAIGTNGTTWTFAYNEAVTCASTANCCDDFIAAMSTAGPISLSYYSGSGTSSVVCTGSPAVYLGDTVANGGIDYTTVTNGIEDGSGNDLASFIDKAVTNNSTLVIPGIIGPVKGCILRGAVIR
jgi:hypothetical protein